MTRTMLTLAVGVAISVGGLTLAQTGHGHGKGPTVKTLSAVDVNEQLNGKPTRATTLEVTFEPGAASAPHRHPGPVFGYVLEGELMVLHAVSRNPSAKSLSNGNFSSFYAHGAARLCSSSVATAGPASAAPGPCLLVPPAVALGSPSDPGRRGTESRPPFASCECT